MSLTFEVVVAPSSWYWYYAVVFRLALSQLARAFFMITPEEWWRAAAGLTTMIFKLLVVVVDAQLSM